MRARQIKLAPKNNLKHKRDGLADIEFLASALALALDRTHPVLREPNTVRLLHALGTVVAPDPEPVPAVPAEPELAPVISMAMLRARRVGHPSAGPRSNAPVTGS